MSSSAAKAEIRRQAPPVQVGAAELIRWLRGISSLTSRALAVGGLLVEGEDRELARVLDELLRLTLLGGEPARDAWLAIARWLVSGPAGEVERRRAELAHAAGEQGLLVARVLDAASPHRELAPRVRLAEVPLQEVEVVSVPSPWGRPGLPLRSRGVPIGATMTATRCLVEVPPAQLRLIFRTRIGHLLRHPSASLIGRLVEQRWITRRDVTFIASRRPTTPAIIRAVAGSERWFSTLEIREALVCNPFSPTDVVLALLPLSSRRTLLHVARAGDAHPLACAAAAALLAATAPRGQRDVGELDPR